MPTWKTHIFLNVLFFVVWLKILLSFAETNVFYLTTVFVFVVVASVFPDIDTTKSKIRDWFSLLLSALITVVYLLNYGIIDWITVPLYFLVLYLFLRYFPTTHRTITHTFFLGLIFSIATSMLLWLIFIPSEFEIFLTFGILFISYSSHLILDAM